MSAPMPQGQPYAGQPVQPPKPRWYTTKWFIGAAALIVGIGIGSSGGGSESTGSPAPAATTTVTVTAQPAVVEKTTTTKPSAATTPARTSLAASVDKAIKDNSPAGLPTWAMPITKIEDMSNDTIRVYYQETLTDAEAKEVGRKIRTFTATNDGTANLTTIVIRDAQGIDHNVFK